MKTNSNPFNFLKEKDLSNKNSNISRKYKKVKYKSIFFNPFPTELEANSKLLFFF